MARSSRSWTTPTLRTSTGWPSATRASRFRPAARAGSAPGSSLRDGTDGIRRAIRRAQRAVRDLDEVVLDLPHVGQRQAPVVPTKNAEIHELVARDPAGEVDVGIEVAPDQVADAAEDRLAAVQARVPRARDRTP